MKKIALTQGKFALVDDEDYEKVGQFKWHYNAKKGYAGRMVYLGGYPDHLKYKGIKMHRFILDAPTDKQVDHINGDKLDNRKSNLRLCNNQQNSWNRGVHKNSKSGIKGVIKIGNRWHSTVGDNGHTVFLGSYKTKEEAALVYDEFVRNTRGEFGVENHLVGSKRVSRMDNRGENSARNKYPESLVRAALETKGEITDEQFAKTNNVSLSWLRSVRYGQRWSWLYKEYYG